MTTVLCPNCNHEISKHGYVDVHWNCSKGVCECPLKVNEVRMAITMYAAVSKANYDAA